MILFTSDADKSGKKALVTATSYLAISIFTAFFGAVYEIFSHGIYSYFMIYAFAFPLVLGTLPFLIFGLKPCSKYPIRSVRCCYHATIATATIGSIIKGVLDIYGTSSNLLWVYVYASAIMFAASIVLYLVQIFRKKQ